MGANKPLVSQVYDFDDVVSPYMCVFFTAFALAMAATPVMILLAHRLGILDRPNYRKIHQTPVAYLGGVALFIGWCAGLLVALTVVPHTKTWDPQYAQLRLPLALVFGAAVVTLAGAWDDAKVIRARYKLLAQLIAAMSLVFSGVGMKIIPGALIALGGYIGHPIVQYFPEWFLWCASAGLITFWVMGACNATNLIDGLDGLAAGITTAAALGFTIIAICLATGMYSAAPGPYSVVMDPVRMAVCLSLLGAVLGFLPYNFKPAVVFMGDAGSNLLGFACISIVLLLGEKGEPVLVIAGLTVLALPIMDTALAILRRAVGRMPITAPDKHHLHHLLVGSGFGVRRSMLLLCLISLGFSALGVAMLFIRLRYVSALAAVIFSFTAITAYKIAHRQRQEESRHRAAAAQLAAGEPPASVAGSAAGPQPESAPVVVARPYVSVSQ